MREIPLTQGHVAFVDDADFDAVSALKWCAWWSGASWYAKRGDKNGNILLHQFLMRPESGMSVDHIDGDGLNNQRSSNLRVCTHAQNTKNKRRYTTNTSGYKGVSWNKRAGAWEAYITVDYKRRHLGLHKDLETAARIYDAAAIQLHGEFARLNFVDGRGAPEASIAS